MTEPDCACAWPDQRPKNNHSKMITGIGTPKSQSRIPRPIFASMNSSTIQERGKQGEVPAAATKNALLMSGIRVEIERIVITDRWRDSLTAL
jgi:hypothetical protein